MASASTGGVLISARAFENVEGKLDLRFACIGVRILKGVARAVEVFALVDATAAARPPTPPPALPDTPSLAVLPFVNMSAGAEQEHFADGLTEDLITTLAATPGGSSSSRAIRASPARGRL